LEVPSWWYPVPDILEGLHWNINGEIVRGSFHRKFAVTFYRESLLTVLQTFYGLFECVHCVVLCLYFRISRIWTFVLQKESKGSISWISVPLFLTEFFVALCNEHIESIIKDVVCDCMPYAVYLFVYRCVCWYLYLCVTVLRGLLRVLL